MNHEPALSHLERILQLHDEAFISQAYEAILFRPVDSSGLANYLSQVRAGVDRERILEEMAESPESREKRASLDTIRQHIAALKMNSKKFRPSLLRRLLDATGESANQRLRAIENRLMGLEHAAAVERSEIHKLAGLMRHLAPDFSNHLTNDGQLNSANKTAAASVDVSAPLSSNNLDEKSEGSKSTYRLRLDSDYSVDKKSWQAYCNFLVADRRKAAVPTTVGLGWKPTLVILVDCSIGMASTQKLSATKSSIESLAGTSECRISSLWLVSPNCELDIQSVNCVLRSDVAGMIAASDLVLVIRPGDEVSLALPLVLKLSTAFTSHLTLIDSYFCEHERVFPLLLHGVDPVSASFCDYFFGRFAALGQYFIGALMEFPDSSPSEIGAQLCAAIAFGHVPKQTHIAIPLLRLAIDSAEIKSARERMSVQTPIIKEPSNRAHQLSVSAIICTKDSGFLLKQLLHHLYESDRISDIVIVSNNTTDIYALRVLEEASKRENVTILSYKGQFNFSRQCNLGVKVAKGEALLFLNDDISPITEDWLEYMLVWLDAPRVVGPLLIYPDQSVQHAGMILGSNGVTGHSLRRSKVPHGEASLLLSVPRHVPCLTGAALLVPRMLFENLNGFDPLLGTYLQDVDLCLRVAMSGWELIFEPRAILMHMESVSISPTLTDQKVYSIRQREFDYFNRRWNRHNLGQWMNPLYDPMDESLRTLR